MRFRAIAVLAAILMLTSSSISPARHALAVVPPGPLADQSPSITFEGAYWVKASGTLTTVPLTASIQPVDLVGCAVTFSLSDGSGTVRTYVATTGLVGDTTTASLPEGTYSVDLLGSGACDGATASGRVTVATGSSTVGTAGSGDYTLGTSDITFDHSVSVETTASKGGGGTGTVTITSGSITWSPTLSPTSTWRLTGAIREPSASAMSAWRPIACPDDIEGFRPSACGHLLAGVYTDELTTGTRGKKLEWVRRGSLTFIVVTVYDGGTSCTVVRRKQVCTALPDWFGLTYKDGYKPPFLDELMTGTMVRLRTGAITVG